MLQFQSNLFDQNYSAMNPTFLALITLVSPAVFVAIALLSWFQAGLRPVAVKKAATAATFISIAIASMSVFFVYKYGLLESSLLGVEQLGFSVRLDALSSLMLSMIALLSFIVIRFSFNYLDGDPQQGAFIGRLAATIASVQLLVLSGNLALLFVSWVLTSVSLHRLLVFYKHRPGAIIAARKKYSIARLGDACLLVAFSLIYFQFDTGNLELIFQELKINLDSGTASTGIEIIALLLVFAALLKSAQFPTHGWLIEVMETPTPVSALLHAGLLNAGPFLIVRMAFIMESSTYAPLLLITVGSFTALFASIVFLTQTSIKTALGYSSVAHMGFSLLTCGLGLYPAAMLHLVAHSFYKAHAFLSSGSVIEVIRATKVTGAKRRGSPARILLAILLALALYSAFAIAWGIDLEKEIALVALGAIIVMGLSTLFTAAIDSSGGLKLLFRATVLSILVTLAFFFLESGFHQVLASQIPELVRPGSVEVIFIILVLLAFGATTFIQLVAPSLPATLYPSLVIHLRNGLYINTIFDRLVRSLYAHNSENKDVLKSNISENQTIEVKSLEKQSA